MPLNSFHPKAYITTKRNVRPGLRTRTRIIKAIEKRATQVNKIATETGLSQGSITYHLRILRKEGIMMPMSKRKPFTWKLTDFGQQKLI
nr:transcriptional regulator [Candidatus Njordarchaeum guaymaensis]